MDRSQKQRADSWVATASSNRVPQREVRRELIREAKSMAKKKVFLDYFKVKKIDGYRLLDHCAIHGKTFFLSLLLDHFNQDPNFFESGKSTLHYAVENGSLESVNYLLKHKKSDLNSKDIYGNTPLHTAIYYDQVEIAHKLLEHNARTDIENHFGRALHAAVLFERIDIVKAIYGKSPAEVNRVVQGFCTPLLCAILDDTDGCEKFLRNVSDVVGKSLLYTIISHKEDECEAFNAVKILLERGAKADIFTEGLEIVPVIAAAKKKWTSVTQLLFDHTTNRIENMEWTISGLMNYVESEEFKKMEKLRNDLRVQTLKMKILVELRNDNILAASLTCQLLKYDMDMEEWSWYSNLCTLIASLKVRGYPINIDSASIFAMIDKSLKQENYELALMAAMGTLALVPDPRDKKYQDKLIEVRNAKQHAAAAKSVEEQLERLLH